MLTDLHIEELYKDRYFFKLIKFPNLFGPNNSFTIGIPYDNEKTFEQNLLSCKKRVTDYLYWQKGLGSKYKTVEDILNSHIRPIVTQETKPCTYNLFCTNTREGKTYHLTVCTFTRSRALRIFHDYFQLPKKKLTGFSWIKDWEKEGYTNICFSKC